MFCSSKKQALFLKEKNLKTLWKIFILDQFLNKLENLLHIKPGSHLGPVFGGTPCISPRVKRSTCGFTLRDGVGRTFYGGYTYHLTWNSLSATLRMIYRSTI